MPLSLVWQTRENLLYLTYSVM